VSVRNGALRLATRGSALARAQADLVARALAEADPASRVDIVEITTAGDERPGSRGAGSPSPTAPAAAGEPGDKSRFVKEIEEALLAGDADLAVHSAKDVPGELPEGLAIVGVPARVDARDALCGAGALDELSSGARVGTSSLRRRAQLLAVRPDLEVLELRGNVDTRLGRLAAGDFDAVLLALAGLKRLDRREGVALAADDFVPAPGQGCLALEARGNDERAVELAARVTDRASLVTLTAERAVATALGASCRTPIGVHATLRPGEGELAVESFVGLPDGSAWVRDRIEGGVEGPAELGREAAGRLLSAGAEEILVDAEAAQEDADSGPANRGVR
jgi:hydroxymethylbilane synthase